MERETRNLKIPVSLGLEVKLQSGMESVFLGCWGHRVEGQTRSHGSGEVSCPVSRGHHSTSQAPLKNACCRCPRAPAMGKNSLSATQRKARTKRSYEDPAFLLLRFKGHIFVCFVLRQSSSV